MTDRNEEDETLKAIAKSQSVRAVDLNLSRVVQGNILRREDENAKGLDKRGASLRFNESSTPAAAVGLTFEAKTVAKNRGGTSKKGAAVGLNLESVNYEANLEAEKIAKNRGPPSEKAAFAGIGPIRVMNRAASYASTDDDSEAEDYASPPSLHSGGHTTQPGAVSVGLLLPGSTAPPPPYHNNGDEDANFAEDPDSPDSPGEEHATSSTPPEAGAPVAFLVDDDEEQNRQKAAPVSDGRNPRKQTSAVALGIIGIAVVVGAVVLGLVFGLGGAKDGDAEPQTPVVPPTTLAPTSFGSMYLDSLNLPKHTTEAISNDANSAQARAYDWVLNDPNRTSYPRWKTLQRFALAVFYYSTGGEEWSLQKDWLSYDVDECSWYFSTIVNSVDTGNTKDVDTQLEYSDAVCNDDGQYLYLVFPASNMRGSLPPEISLLSDSLHSLDVALNEGIYGWIPSEIGLLTNLVRFYCDRNILTSLIPTEFGQLTNLRELELGYNLFTGPVPSEIGSLEALTMLSVRWCPEVSGTIPTEIGRLTNLEQLYFHGSENLLGGQLLSSITKLNKLQIFLSHDVDYQSATIPTEIGLLSDLTLLNLWKCKLSGSLPSELFLMTKLSFLTIADNPMMAGTIATEFGLLSNLEVITLGRNGFTGPLPGSIFETWGNVTIFFCHGNNLEGPLPTQLGLLTSMERLWLKNTDFLGTIPSQLGLLTNMTELFLHDTDLIGTIPESLSEISESAFLSVSNTSLTGSIPVGLCDRIWDFRYQCTISVQTVAVTNQFCKAPEKVNFTCSSTDLCGCDSCDACNSTI